MPIHNNVTPCLVPPPDMHLFTEQERHALLELEWRVIPLIPVGPNSVIWRLGGPYLALFAICAPIDWSFKEMGVYEQAQQELSFHDWWFLNRWWHFYKNLIINSVPQAIRDHQRRHIFHTPEELIERFLSIDFSLCPERFYPLDRIGHEWTMRDIERGRRVDWNKLECWYDFAEECPYIMSTRKD